MVNSLETLRWRRSGPFAVAVTVAVTVAPFFGCNAPVTTPASGNRPMTTAMPPAVPPDPLAVPAATVGSVVVTRGELYDLLAESYGLNPLMSLVRLRMAEQEAVRRGVRARDADVAEERRLTLARMFEGADPDDYDGFLEQFLQQQRLSAPEFDLVLRTNAALRKIAEPMLVGKLTDDHLRDAFNARYGQSVRVRHIAVDNLQEAAEARRRLDAGETFADVAADVSRNPHTRVRGGELQPFTRNSPAVPPIFAETAFTLQPGQVSDPVQAEGQYHLILLEERLEPRAARFEDVRDELRAELQEAMEVGAIREIRDELGRQAIAQLRIHEPAISRQFEERRADAAVRDPAAIRRRLAEERPEERPGDRPDEPAEASDPPASGLPGLDLR